MSSLIVNQPLLPVSPPVPDGRLCSSRTGALAARLRGAIETRTARVGVIGLGYVGLPLVELFAGKGFPVLGFDVDATKVERLQAGQSYIGHIASERVAALRDGGHFEATSDFGRLSEADAILICVPTPLGLHREPDLSAVIATGRSIGQSLRPGQLVVLESTTYPGTTRDVLRPESGGGRASGRAGLLPGLQPRTRGPGQPGLLGPQHPQGRRGLGRGQRGTGRGCSTRPPCRGWSPSRSCEVAEACKILENTYRAVNIALVNELKLVFERMGIDVWEVIDAAKTKPFGFQAFYPGPGLGRTLHPDRSLLSDLGRPRVRAARPGSSSWPARSTPRCRITSSNGSMAALNDRGKAIKGSRVLRPGRRLQAERRRLPREPGVRDHRTARRAGRPSSPTTTRTSRSCRRGGTMRSGWRAHR